MNLIPRDSLFDFDRAFGDFFGNLPRLSESQGVFAPRVDVHEKARKYVIDAELPGVDKDDVKVTLENGVLTFEASMEDETSKEEDGRVVRRERRFGRFSRSFYLGEDIQQADIKAKFKNGVLKLEIRKVEPKVPEKKRIEIL